MKQHRYTCEKCKKNVGMVTCDMDSRKKQWLCNDCYWKREIKPNDKK